MSNKIAKYIIEQQKEIDSLNKSLSLKSQTNFNLMRETQKLKNDHRDLSGEVEVLLDNVRKDGSSFDPSDRDPNSLETKDKLNNHIKALHDCYLHRRYKPDAYVKNEPITTANANITVTFPGTIHG